MRPACLARDRTASIQPPPFPSLRGVRPQHHGRLWDEDYATGEGPLGPLEPFGWDTCDYDLLNKVPSDYNLAISSDGRYGEKGEKRKGRGKIRRG